MTFLLSFGVLVNFVVLVSAKPNLKELANGWPRVGQIS